MRPPVQGRVSSKFGYRRHPITGVRSFHNGVDIAVPVGTDVLAPESGKILECWDHPRGGISMSMMSFTGTRYGFCHLSSRLVKAGDVVKEGQHIAETGNTGSSTGPHVHFTVKKHEVWQDPQNLFGF